MSLRFRFLLPALLMACMFAVGEARADYQFCNRTSYVLDGAIGYQYAGAWKSRGWTRLMPGDCGAVLTGDIADTPYRVFARSAEVHQGAVKYFAGNERFCTVDDRFEIDGRDRCGVRGYDTSDFMAVDTKPGADWTTTFSEPADYSDDQARVAGVQRLLRDNGFTLARIDGIAARNTTRAIEGFQRAAGVSADGKIDDNLMALLVARAEEEQAKAGLDVCNRTGHLVWAAVGWSAIEGDVSSGWLRVAPGQCRKAIKGKLAASNYFFYAEAVDDAGAAARRDGQRLVWDGDDRFCTKTTRFEIRGRERCAARGFDERGFLRVGTGGSGKHEIGLD